MGFPKVLIVTNPIDDPHSDRVLSALESMDVEVVRWHPEALLTDCIVKVDPGASSVEIRSSGRSFTTGEISAVWYRRPRAVRAPVEFDRETALLAKHEGAAIVEAVYRDLRCIWYSHPVFMKAASNKLRQLATAQSLGFDVPDYLVTRSGRDVEAFFERHGGRVIIKPVSTRTVVHALEEVGLPLQTGVLTEGDVVQCRNAVLATPVFLQQRIDRVAEIRTTVIGAEVASVAMHTGVSIDDPDADGRLRTVSSPHSVIATDPSIERRILSFQRTYGLNYGAFDFLFGRDGTWWFLECNQGGQFAWLDEKVPGLSLVGVMARHLAGAEPPLVTTLPA